MGIGVDVLTIQEISDEEDYLNALGKKRTAEVKRDASIGEAEALRDAKIKSSLALQEGERAKFGADAEIAQAQSHLEKYGVAIEVGPVLRNAARGDGISIYFRDPDGSLLEFISYEKSS